MFVLRQVMRSMSKKIPDEDLRNKLSKLAYQVTQENSTEPARSHFLWNHSPEGDYTCICCDKVLFNSTSKFISECGWPAFSSAFQDSVKFLEDNSHGMKRTEVRCNNCDAHLGHIFNDGPTPSKKRFCINGVCLKSPEPEVD